MSFRYTNNLIGALKHRLLLESSYREIASRKFIGNCRGVEVVCSGYGTVLAVQLTDKAVWESFYRKGGRPTVSGGGDVSGDAETGTQGSATTTGATGDLDLDKLAESIKTALWDATRKIRSAKEAALHRSLSHNTRMRASADLKHWYEEDANTLRPLAFEALKHEAATPWMQLVQHGKKEEAAALLKEFEQKGDAAEATPTRVKDDRVKGTRTELSNREQPPLASTLKAEDSNPATIPIGSVHPLFTPALVQIEEAGGGSVSNEAVCRAQLWELSRDEQLFWERVELIRKGQVASIGSSHKRGYADEAAFAKDDTEEKVQLRFTQ
uniref:mS58 n=1 Tax=Trypanosoma brucei brucei TaxID=5702 RepID=UPI001EFF5DD1|nr:Chain DK, mS58 [Trypanosoma brucei brucei]